MMLHRTASIRDAAAVTAVSSSVTRHRASTSMYSLIFHIHVMLPEHHQWKPAVQAAAVMLRIPPVTCRSAERGHPAECSHYVVI